MRLGLGGFGILVTAFLAMAAHLFAIVLAKALSSYSRSLLEHQCAERGRPGRAEEVAHLDQKTERGAEALAVLSGLLLAALVGMGVDQFSPAFRVEWTIVLVLAIGLFGYVLGGAVGKVLAERIIDVFWPVAGALRAAMFPFTFCLRQIERTIERAAGADGPGPRPSSVEVEVPGEDNEARDDAEPELPEAVRELLQRVIALTRTDVAEIMTPRPRVVSLPATVSAESAAATFHLTGLSRLPIFGANHDDVVGILYAKDLFPRMTQADGPAAVVPRDLVRPAHFVPETKNALELLEELRAERRQIAIVLDEYGGFTGLITLEDLVERLVGPIDDEHDIPAAAEPIRELGGSRYEVDATVPVEALNQRLDLHLPTNGDFLTVGGLAFHTLGRVPSPGESFQSSGVAFQILDLAGHRIRRLLMDVGDGR